MTTQMTTTLIIGVTIAAILVLLVVFKLMSSPIATDEAPPAVPQQPSPEIAETEEPVADEPRRTGTPGFVLPPPDTAAARMAATATPPPSQPAAPAPRRNPSPPPSEGTVSLGDPVYARLVSERPETKSPVVRQATLVFLNGPREGEKVNLDSFSGGECAVGRSEVPENQIVVRDDLKVSRVRHAIFTRNGEGTYSVRDNNSANRVFVNEKCIEDTPTLLHNGDKIRIGLTELAYVNDLVSNDLVS